MKLSLVILFLTLAMIVTGCATPIPEVNPADGKIAGSSAVNNNNPGGKADLTITMTSAGFSPSKLTINAGDMVTFVNKDVQPHWPASNIHPVHAAYDGTTLAEHCSVPGSTTFDACRGLLSEESFSFTVEKIGSWSYHDHLNPNLGGTIVVK